MLPHKHAIIAATVGIAGWWGTGEPTAFVAALATGVLPDVDHAVDYAYYYRQGDHRLILPLHGYEYALVGGMIALVSKNNILGIAALSYLIHLLADQAENSTKIGGYFLLFRAWHRFRIDQISTVPEAAIRGRLDDIEMLKRLWQRRKG